MSWLASLSWILRHKLLYQATGRLPPAPQCTSLSKVSVTCPCSMSVQIVWTMQESHVLRHTGFQQLQADGLCRPRQTDLEAHLMI